MHYIGYVCWILDWKVVHINKALYSRITVQEHKKLPVQKAETEQRLKRGGKKFHEQVVYLHRYKE